MTFDDVAAIGAVQARAFFDDPLQMWAIPDAALRLELLERMFTLLARVVNVPSGEAYTDTSLSAAAFWVAPGRYGEPLAREARAELATLEQQVSAEILLRLTLANDAMHGAHPHDAHWYLQGIGTDPSARGRGLASALIEIVTARADAAEVPCYLESTKAENVGLYERHGFVVTGTISVPEGGPTLWPMWRIPNPLPRGVGPRTGG